MKRTDHRLEGRLVPVFPSPICRLLTKILPLAIGGWLLGFPHSARADFVPGEGGAIPVIAPLPTLPNRIGGLKVDQIDRENDWFGGTRAMLELSFPAPSVHGATGYDLQRSPDGGTTWEPLYATSSDTQYNFSFDPAGTWSYRLVVTGGPKNGYTSNVVSAPVSGINTRFAGWFFDESMFISGVMTPWVGHGMSASFTVRKLSDDSEVSGGLTYQWYRVNPLTSEMTPISGATGLTYVTTADDLGGYHFLCKATGDETTVGGFIQVGSSQPVLIPNKSFASNVGATGFRLNLHKSIPSLAPADLELSYWNGATTVIVPITSVTPLAGNASFDLAVTIPGDAQTLSLGNKSDIWRIGEEMSFFPGMPPHFMQSLTVRMPAVGFDNWIAGLAGIPAGSRGPLDRNGPLGLANLTAYAMGLNPLTATADDLPAVSSPDTTAGTLHFIYRRAKNLTDVTLTPRVSPDLQSWKNATVISETVLQDGGTWQRVDALISFGPNPEGFLNLVAETSGG